MKRPAVFFDRDNTLIACDGYLGDPEKVVLIDGAADAVVRVRDLGFAAVVFSNQSGVARGMFAEEAVHAVNHRMDDLLHEDDPRAVIDRHDFCPYHPAASVPRYRVDSDLRKPKPGMIHQAERVLDLDLRHSWVIGDAPRDIAAGRAAGLRTVLLRIASLPPSPATNEGAGATPDFVASSLREAVDYIERNRDVNGVAADAGAAGPDGAGSDGDGEPEVVGFATPDAPDPEDVPRPGPGGANDADVVVARDDAGAGGTGAGGTGGSGTDGQVGTAVTTDAMTADAVATDRVESGDALPEDAPSPRLDAAADAAVEQTTTPPAVTASPDADAWTSVPAAEQGRGEPAAEPAAATATAFPDVGGGDVAANVSASGDPAPAPSSRDDAAPVEAAQVEAAQDEAAQDEATAGRSAGAAARLGTGAPAERSGTSDGGEDPVKIYPRSSEPSEPTRPEPTTPDPAVPEPPAKPAAKPVQGGFVVKPAQGSMTWGERMRVAKQGGSVGSAAPVAAAAASPSVPKQAAFAAAAAAPAAKPAPVPAAPPPAAAVAGVEQPPAPAEPATEVVAPDPAPAAVDENDPDLPPAPERPAAPARAGWRREDAAAAAAAPPRDGETTTAVVAVGRPASPAPEVAVEDDATSARQPAPAAAARGTAARGGAGTGDPSRVEDLLEQVLAELRRREEMSGGDFSVSKLMAGVTQVLALAALFYAYFNKDSSHWLEPTLLVALTLQTLTISLLIMGRQR